MVLQKCPRRGSVCICGAPRCVPPPGVVLGRRRSERGSLGPASQPGPGRRAGVATKQGLLGPIPQGPPPGASGSTSRLKRCKESFTQCLISVLPARLTGTGRMRVYPLGWGGRGGRGGVSAAHSQVINAGFLRGAAAFPWQRSASQLPRSLGCRRLRCKWSSSLWPPRQPASSCSWYSSSSSQSTSALGLSTSLCPRTVKCKKKSVVARGAPNGAAHHKGRYLLHPTGPEAVLASAPRPRCGDARHGFTVHRPWGLVSTDINQ